VSRERKRDSLRGRDVTRNIERVARERERRGPVETRDDSVLAKIKAGAKSVVEKVGPVAAKVQEHARKVNAQQARGGGGMGMDFGFTPFAGGLPSTPGGFGFGPAPRERAPRKGGGSRTTIHTGGKTITITSGGGKKKKRKGGGSGGGGLPPWHPNFRLPY
jgi:hypothetical protein